jgi:hypothetical protein
MVDCTMDKNLIIADGVDKAMLAIKSDADTRVYIEYGTHKLFANLEKDIEKTLPIQTIEPGLKSVMLVVPKEQPRYIELKSVINESAGIKALQDQIQGLQMALAELTILLAGGEA